MDLMVHFRLLVLGGLVIVFALTLGPALGLSRLLEHRDRRRSKLIERVLEGFADEVRRRINIDMGYAVFSRKGVVTLDMRACSPGEIWDVIAPVSRSLPPGVRLKVVGYLDGGPGATFRLETPGWPQPAPATGR